ncbi:MAG: hypothetical protein HPY76_12435 [Anaerolineae bacterium]|nr:hypothetical protein [Anaerolineae bacterium]
MGGLTLAQAGEQVQRAYAQPLQLTYHDAAILADPADLGFHMNLDAMLAAAQDQDPTGSAPLRAFWRSLWRRVDRSAIHVDLIATINRDALRTYLEAAIIPRYDQPPRAPLPQPGATGYQPGVPGWALDVDSAISLIETALRSPLERVVALPVIASDGGLPLPENLAIQLRQLTELSGFDGLVSLVMIDLQTNRSVQYSQWDGATVDLPVAFSAASTMKIPIMVSVMRRTAEPTPPEVLQLFDEMIVYSRNPPSDSLMERIDPVSGPLLVTADLQALGLQNSFIAGYFYLGAPLLKLYETPANQRTDIDLEPDIYNQTSPEEVAALLQAIYQCAEDNSGSLVETFPNEITQSECRTMIDTLARNKIGLLIETGVPDGTTVAHKHGWFEEEDGLLHAMSDVALVYTPGGDYALTIFMYHPDQLVFDPANDLVTQLSRAVYNYFNTKTK